MVIEQRPAMHSDNVFLFPTLTRNLCRQNKTNNTKLFFQKRETHMNIFANK